MYLVFSSVLLVISVFIYYKSSIKEKEIREYMEKVSLKLERIQNINKCIYKQSIETDKLSNKVLISEKKFSDKNIEFLEYENFSQKETIKWVFLNFILDFDLMTKHSDIYNVIYYRLRESEPEFIEKVIRNFSDGDVGKIKEMISEVSNSIILLAPVESNEHGVN